MVNEIEPIAGRILEHLRRQPDQTREAMHLKLELEISASKLFLALGWLLRENQVALQAGEYGYAVKCLSGIENRPAQRVAEGV